MPLHPRSRAVRARIKRSAPKLASLDPALPPWIPQTSGAPPREPQRRPFNPGDIAGFGQLAAMGVVVPRKGPYLLPPWDADHPELPPDFETPMEMKLERHHRIILLGRDGSEPALELLRVLRGVDPHTSLPLANLACPLYGRWVRIRFLAAVVAWLVRQPQETLYEVTCIAPAMFVPGGELWTPENPRAVVPSRLHNLFRKHLNQVNARQEGGWLLWGLDASFEASSTGKHTGYQFHMHGIANEAMLPAIERLREIHPAYRATDWVHQPVRKERIRYLAGAITYLVKSFWVQRNCIDARDTDEFVRRGSRLPHPYYTEALMWRSLQKFGDMFRMYGCEPQDLPRFVRGSSW